MFKKTLLFSAVAVVLAVMTVATASALLDTWNRPNPLMDYVPQEVGIYDTRYDNLGELDCRACHGDSLADRHHYTEIVLRDRLCTPCHEIIPDPPGVVVIRDCSASGCHSWDDVYVNGWHHDTDLSASDNCVACHDASEMDVGFIDDTNVFTTGKISSGRGGETFEPAYSHDFNKSADCARCHYEGNPWGRTVIESTSARG